MFLYVYLDGVFKVDCWCMCDELVICQVEEQNDETNLSKLKLKWLCCIGWVMMIHASLRSIKTLV